MQKANAFGLHIDMRVLPWALTSACVHTLFAQGGRHGGDRHETGQEHTPVFLIAATRHDLATKVCFRVRRRDARQGVPKHLGDAEISGEYPV
eukprot:755737-Pelagomonas_calceolata.AAC.3